MLGKGLGDIEEWKMKGVGGLGEGTNRNGWGSLRARGRGLEPGNGQEQGPASGTQSQTTGFNFPLGSIRRRNFPVSLAF